MSLARTFGRLLADAAKKTAQKQVDRALYGQQSTRFGYSRSEGRTIATTIRTGGLFGVNPDADGDGRVTLAERRAAERSHERRQNILRAIGLGGAAFVTGKDTAAEPDPAAEVIDAAPDLPEETAALMIRAMILAAACDGEIDAEERARIEGHVADAPAQDRAFVAATLDAPGTLDALIADAPAEEEMRAQLYLASLAAIDIDAPEEEAHMRALAAGLGLSDDMVTALHADLGRAPL